MKNRYLNLSAVRKFKMNQDKPKRSNANPEPAAAIHDQFSLIMSTIKQTLTIPLLMKEALFT